MVVMAEGLQRPGSSDVRQQDVNAMFQAMGERLGWFKHKDLSAAVQSLSCGSKKSVTSKNVLSKPTTGKENAKRRPKLLTKGTEKVSRDGCVQPKQVLKTLSFNDVLSSDSDCSMDGRDGPCFTAPAKMKSGKARTSASKTSEKAISRHFHRYVHDQKSGKKRNKLAPSHNDNTHECPKPQKNLLKSVSFDDVLSSDSDSNIPYNGEPWRGKAILEVDSGSEGESIVQEDTYISCIEESIQAEPEQPAAELNKDANPDASSSAGPQSLNSSGSPNAIYNETILKSRVSLASVNLDMESFWEPLVESTRIYDRSSTSSLLTDSGRTINASSNVGSSMNKSEEDDSYKQLNIHPSVRRASPTDGKVRDNVHADVDLCSSLNSLHLKHVGAADGHRFDAKYKDGSGDDDKKVGELAFDETKYVTALEKWEEWPNEFHESCEGLEKQNDVVGVPKSGCPPLELDELRNPESSDESIECVEVVDAAVQTEPETDATIELKFKQKKHAFVYDDETAVRLDDETVETVGRSDASVYEQITTDLNIPADDRSFIPMARHYLENNCEQALDSFETRCEVKSAFNEATVLIDNSKHTTQIVSNTDDSTHSEPTVLSDIGDSAYEQQTIDVDEFPHGNDVRDNCTVIAVSMPEIEGHYTKETLVDATDPQFDESTLSDGDGNLHVHALHKNQDQNIVEVNEPLSLTGIQNKYDPEHSFPEPLHTTSEQSVNDKLLFQLKDLESDDSVSDASLIVSDESVCEVVDVATQTDKSFQHELKDTEYMKQRNNSDAPDSKEESVDILQEYKEDSSQDDLENANATLSGGNNSSSEESDSVKGSCISTKSPEPDNRSPPVTFAVIANSVPNKQPQGKSCQDSISTDQSWRDSRRYSSESDSDDDKLENFFQKMKSPAKEDTPPSSPLSMKDFIVDDDDMSSESDDDDGFHFRHTQYLENMAQLKTSEKTHLPQHAASDGDDDVFSSTKFPKSVTKHKKRQQNASHRSWCFTSDSEEEDDHVDDLIRCNGKQTRRVKNMVKKHNRNGKENISEVEQTCVDDQVPDGDKDDSPLFKTPNFIRKKTKTNTDSIKRNVIKSKSFASNVSSSSSSSSDSDESASDEAFISSSSLPSIDQRNVSAESAKKHVENNLAIFNKLPTPVSKGRQPKIATPMSSRGSHTHNFLYSLSTTVEDCRRHPEAVRYVRGFKKNKDDLVQHLYSLYNRTIFEEKLPKDMLIQFNSRLLKTAGYCAYKWNRAKPGDRTAQIQLSTKVCDSAERVRDTLIHEMCHAAVWLLNEVNGGHGPFWKYWARQANRVHPELPIVKRCHSYDINTKFTYRCTKCGSSVGRHSKSIDIDKKICARCHGRFELIVNATPSSSRSSNSDSAVVTPSTPRTPNRFALFVKDHYSDVKKQRTDLKHGEIMKELSKLFAESKLSS